MNKSILLATIAVLLVAGCTSQGGNIQFPWQSITPVIAGGAGLVMTDFSPDQPTVYGGSTDRIMMTVKNAGGYAVPDSDSLIYLTGSAISFTGGDIHTYWTNTTTADSPIKHFGTTMKPADVVKGTDPDEKTITWNLKAPNITTQTITTTFIGRAYYDYETDVNGNIWVYSSDEADAARAAKRPIYQPTFIPTSGPVALTVTTSPTSVILSSGDMFTLNIRVSSVAGGTLYRNNIINYATADTGDDLKLTEDQLNKVYISVSAPGLTVTNPADCTGEQELIGGKDIKLACTMSVDSLPATLQSYPITITALYGYYVDKQTTVTVQKR
jgi:hypothetical protein